MYKVRKNRKVFYPVRIDVLSDDGGETEQVEIFIQYEIFTRKEMLKEQKAAVKRAKATMFSLDDIEALKDDEFDDMLYSRCHDWKLVCDENDDPVPFSREALRALCDADAAFYKGVSEGLFLASSGAPVKNSKSGLVT